MWSRTLAHILCRALEFGLAVGVIGLAASIGAALAER